MSSRAAKPAKPALRRRAPAESVVRRFLRDKRLPPLQVRRPAGR